MRSLVLAMTIGAFSLPAPAATSPDAVRAWLNEEWARAQELPHFDGFSIAWRLLEHTTHSEEEIARLRDEVQGKPHHPMRTVLELIDERARTGRPSVTGEFRLFLAGEAWRFCESLPNGEYIDRARTPTQPWQLSSRSLVLFDPRDAGVQGRSVDGQEFTFMPMVGELLFGALNLGRISRISLQPPRIDGNRWRAIARSAAAPGPKAVFAVEYAGRWNDDLGRGFVDEFTIIEHGSRPEVVGERRLFRDWAFHPIARMWIAARSDRYLASGKLTRTLELISVDPLPPGGFAAIAAPPAVNGADPIRGSFTFTSIVDHRESSFSQREPDTGSWQHSSLPTPPRASPGGWLRILGWSVLVAASALLAFLIVRRRRILLRERVETS